MKTAHPKMEHTYYNDIHEYNTDNFTTDARLSRLEDMLTQLQDTSPHLTRLEDLVMQLEHSPSYQLHDAPTHDRCTGYVTYNDTQSYHKNQYTGHRRHKPHTYRNIPAYFRHSHRQRRYDSFQDDDLQAEPLYEHTFGNTEGNQYQNAPNHVAGLNQGSTDYTHTVDQQTASTAESRELITKLRELRHQLETLQIQGSYIHHIETPNPTAVIEPSDEAFHLTNESHVSISYDMRSYLVSCAKRSRCSRPTNLASIRKSTQLQPIQTENDLKNPRNKTIKKQVKIKPGPVIHQLPNRVTINHLQPVTKADIPSTLTMREATIHNDRTVSTDRVTGSGETHTREQIYKNSTNITLSGHKRMLIYHTKGRQRLTKPNHRNNMKPYKYIQIFMVITWLIFLLTVTWRSVAFNNEDSLFIQYTLQTGINDTFHRPIT